MDGASTIAFTQKVRLSESVLMEDLSGEAILLDLASEEYFALDAVATEMLATLNQAESIQAAHGILLAQYEVEPEVLQQDLLDYVEQLSRDGLVEVVTT